MSIRACGKLRSGGSGTRGFVLIELLVVIAILAVVAVGAVFSALESADAKPWNTASGLEQAIRFAQDEMLYTGRIFGVAFAEGSWGLLRFRPGVRDWVPVAPEHPFSAGHWPGTMTARLRIEGRSVVLRSSLKETDRPDVFLLPDGRISAFEFQLSTSDGRIASCGIDPDSGFDCGTGR